MGLVEGVSRERLDEVEDLLRQPLLVALLHRAGDEALALGQHHLGDLLSHRLPHHVRLAERVTGEGARDLQYLVLVRDHPVGLVEDRREVGVRVVCLRAAVLHLNVARDVLHRPWPVEGDHRGQLADIARPQLGDVAAHAGGLQLEDPERLPPRQHLGRELVAVGDRFKLERLAGRLTDEVGRTAEDGEVGEAEVVELEEADFGHVVHRVLRGGERVVILVFRRCRALERDHIGQRLARDDDAGGVRARVPGDALQPPGGVHKLADLRLIVVVPPQLRDLVERLIDGDVQQVGDQPCDAVDVAVVHAQRATGVANRGLRPQRPEGDDLRDAILAVALGGVADDLFTTVVGEVEVDVRHLTAFEVQEALEHQPVLGRLDVRDAEAVEDDRGGGGAPYAHRDLALVREVGDVAHDQDVLQEAGLLDHLELVAQSLAVRLGRRAVPPLQTLVAELMEMLGGRLAGRDARIGEQRAAEVEADVHLLRDAGRVVAGLRQLREERAHLLL